MILKKEIINRKIIRYDAIYYYNRHSIPQHYRIKAWKTTVYFMFTGRQISIIIAGLLLSLLTITTVTSATTATTESPRAHLHVVGTLWFMSDINQPSLPTPFYSVLASIPVFMAFSTVFHSINSPNNCPFSDCSSGLISALLVLSTLCLFMKSPSALI